MSGENPLLKKLGSDVNNPKILTRTIPLILLSSTELSETLGIPPVIRINENTTFEEVNRDLSAVTKNFRYQVLQEILGPRPCWRSNEGNKRIPRTTDRLFIIDTISHLVLGVVRGGWDDYPVLLELPSDVSGVTVWDLIRAQFGDNPSIKSVTLYDGDDDVRDMTYDHDAMKLLPSFPTAFFITLTSNTKASILIWCLNEHLLIKGLDLVHRLERPE
ncbi:hypothetical protein PIIN_08537 [Serendipita indica DSM 11827]|uniref:Uncharacterized protein n=1 Tax=Serendipita indica (strain DSM 11827) TaxID=1109443 RepID=G4TTE2_SERID|nr:hypothetical protein PIIN_08537 [Serendipita indica DSM 11827]